MSEYVSEGLENALRVLASGAKDYPELDVIDKDYFDTFLFVRRITSANGLYRVPLSEWVAWSKSNANGSDLSVEALVEMDEIFYSAAYS